MSVNTTLPGVFLKGVAASRPAASAVAAGTVYSATDTGVISQSDGSSWSTWATIAAGLADPMTTRGDTMYRNASNVTARLAVGTAGKVVSSDGTDVSWGYPPFHGVRAYHNTTQTVAAGASLLLLLNSERYDTDTYHSTSSNTSRLTVPSGLGGYYLIGYTLDVASVADAGEFLVEVYLNGATILSVEQRALAAGKTGDFCGSTTYALVATDYVECRVVQTTTVNTRTINSGASYSPEFWMHLIGV